MKVNGYSSPTKRGSFDVDSYGQVFTDLEELLQDDGARTVHKERDGSGDWLHITDATADPHVAVWAPKWNASGDDEWVIIYYKDSDDDGMRDGYHFLPGVTPHDKVAEFALALYGVKV
jgi:hypothetical protein